MFTKNKNPKNTMADNQDADPNSRNLIGKGTTISGEVNSDGVIRLDGVIKGNLTTKAKLVIGESGAIYGDINCHNADISGKVEGKIIVKELLSIKAAATIKGELYTKQLTIEPGAIFDGTCDMSGNSPQQKTNAASAGKQEAPKSPSGQMNEQKQPREKSK